MLDFGAFSIIAQYLFYEKEKAQYEVATTLIKPDFRLRTPYKKSVRLISFAQFNGTRANGNVKAVTAVVLDIDCGISFEKMRESIRLYEYLVYSTHSHSIEKSKYRIIFPLTRPVTSKEYILLWIAINHALGDIADTQARDAARISYLPSCPVENIGIAFAYHNCGLWLDPDRILAAARKNGVVSAATKANKKKNYNRAIPRHIRGRFNRARLPTPEAVLRRLNIEIPSRINSAGYWQLPCPFHKDGKEEHPSLSLHSVDGHYCCFACDAKGGDVLAFYMAVTGRKFKEAAYILGAWR